MTIDKITLELRRDRTIGLERGKINILFRDDKIYLLSFLLLFKLIVNLWHFRKVVFFSVLRELTYIYPIYTGIQLNSFVQR